MLRSDVYELDDAGDLTSTHEGDEPYVDLDPAYFKILADFDEPGSRPGRRRWSGRPAGVRGDVAFGRDVTVRGSVRVEQTGEGQLQIEDEAVLEG